MPQPNETERALMALLQQERERNGSQQAAAEPVLPDLDPSMFLSAAAQREVEAVRGIPDISLPLMTETLHANRQELQIRPVATTEEIDLMSSNWNLSDEDFEPPRFAAQEVAPDLANLFMDRALRETGASPADLRRSERLGNDLDFSFTEMSGDIDIDYSRRPSAGGGSGGVEVARRGPNGGFTPISRQEAVARDRTSSASQPRPQPAAQPTAPSAPVRSRYERLLGPSIID